MRLVLLTTLEFVDRYIIERIEALGYTVEVVRVNSLDPLTIRGVLEGRSFDYAIVPGSSPYDYSEFRGRVVKGPISPWTLPYVLELITPDRLSSRIQAEKVLGETLMLRLARRVLDDVFRDAVWAFSIRGLKVPLRPPPLLVASDVYVSNDVDKVELEVSYRVSEGANVVVLSSSPALDRSVYLKTLSKTLELGVPVAADPGDPGLLVEALDMGVHMAMSLTLDNLDSIPSRYRGDAAYVIIPRVMSSWRSRVRELRRAYEKALELGYEHIILDPVVNPPVNRGVLQSLIAASELSKLVKAPLMLGLNNAVEMMDVDTHATIALLTLMAGEAGVSLVMVGEESYKARGSTREAKIASILASVSLKLRTPPKDLGLTLLQFKGKRPPEDVTYNGHGLIQAGGLQVDCRSLSSPSGISASIQEDVIKRILDACRPWVEVAFNIES